MADGQHMELSHLIPTGGHAVTSNPMFTSATYLRNISYNYKGITCKYLFIVIIPTHFQP
jgi:hypothetical protein